MLYPSKNPKKIPQNVQLTIPSDPTVLLLLINIKLYSSEEDTAKFPIDLWSTGVVINKRPASSTVDQLPINNGKRKESMSH